MNARFFVILLVLGLAGCTATGPAARSPDESTPDREVHVPLTITPEHPQAGRPVTVSYFPGAKGARLRAPSTLELVYRTQERDSRILPMKKQGRRWTAQFAPDSSARFLRLYVQSDSVKDQQNSAGWGHMIYGSDGQPVRGAHAARAAFLRDQYEEAPQHDSLVINAYRRELARHPGHLVARAHLYALEAQRSDPARADSLRRALRARLDTARQAARRVEDARLLREVQRAHYALGHRDQAQSVGATLAQVDSLGPEAVLGAFRRATADGMSTARAQRRAEAFLERFPQSFFVSGVHEALFERYREAGKHDAMLRAGRRWIRTERVNRARAHGQVARALGEAGHHDTALEHARNAVAAASEAPSGYSLFITADGWGWAPTPLTPAERRAQDRRQRGKQRAVLGRIHLQQQRYAKAAQVLARAVEENPAQPSAWVHLARAYDAASQPERAFAAAEEALRRAPMHEQARPLFRQLYVARHGSEEGLEAARARLARGKLLRERLNQPAPPLRLTSFDGDSLRTDSLRTDALAGQVLVVDFWASWCGPCHQAFPHLQAVYEEYRDAPDVTFLVVNTSWNDTQARARRFIEEAGYTFPLYWDAGGQVARAFGVNSLPTTVLIGKEGRVQYRERGFSGAERYVEGLTWRIDLLRAVGNSASQAEEGAPSSR